MLLDSGHLRNKLKCLLKQDNSTIGINGAILKIKVASLFSMLNDAFRLRTNVISFMTKYMRGGEAVWWHFFGMPFGENPAKVAYAADKR